MNIYLGYPSAIEYLQAMNMHLGSRPEILDACNLEDATATVGAVLSAGLIFTGAGETPSSLTLSTPIYLLLPGDRGKSRSSSVTSRTWSKPIPSQSLCKYKESLNMAISTPGFCFLQAASSLAFEDLLQLGLELCGTYSSGPQSTDGVYDLRPLASKYSLECYLDKAGQTTAACRARKAVGMLIDRIASPMEGVTYLLLCLPLRYGGYGLPKPFANYRIDLRDDLREYSDYSYVKADLCWPSARLIIEYDSDEHHRGGENAAKDSARRTLLSAMGYEVHVVNMSLLKNERYVDQLVSHIEHLLKERHKTANTFELERRRRLRTRLLDRSRDWKHSRRDPHEPDASRRN